MYPRGNGGISYRVTEKYPRKYPQSFGMIRNQMGSNRLNNKATSQ